MANDWTDRVIQQWTTEEVKLNHGSTVEVILKAEEILGFNFPDDFRELYLRLTDFPIGTGDPTCFPYGRLIEF